MVAPLPPLSSSNCDVLNFCGPVDHGALWKLVATLEARPRRHDNLLLVMTTMGGLADPAYKMVRLLQARYPRISLFVPFFCKSAGTLMALGADEIIMSDHAELGPLDVQLSKPDETGEQSSGMTPTQSLITLSDEAVRLFEQQFFRIRRTFRLTSRTTAEIAAKLTIGLLGPIYSQIDPMRMGEVQRELAVAREYGTRLGRGNVKRDALSTLVSGFPSHTFVIDREEARQRFFERVSVTGTFEMDVMLRLTRAGARVVWDGRPETEILFLDFEPLSEPSHGHHSVDVPASDPGPIDGRSHRGHSQRSAPEVLGAVQVTDPKPDPRSRRPKGSDIVPASDDDAMLDEDQPEPTPPNPIKDPP